METHHSALNSDLRGLLEALADAVLVLDLTGTVMFANPRAIELFPEYGADLVGQRLDLPTALGPTTEVELDSAFDGSSRTVELHTAAVRWEGRTAHVVTLRDVTAHLRAESLERQLMQSDRLTAIGRVVAGVAHEVNNPAMYITGNLDTIRRRAKDLVDERKFPMGFGIPKAAREIADLVDECAEGIRRIASITTHLRSFSRVCDEDVEMVDPRDVVNTACKMLAGPLRTQANVKIDIGEVPKIAGHRSKLIQVVTNLLTNALDAVGEVDRAGRISISVRETLGNVVIGVEDNGPGIPGGMRDKVFEPFFTTKRGRHGTGLGLTMCTEILRTHNGALHVESQPNEGSLFEVRLPSETGLTPPGEANVIHVTDALKPKRRLRVLAVDDEPVLVRCYKQMLEDHCDVIIALDGDEALSRVLRGPDFDVLVCDIEMPGLDGPALYSALRSKAPHHCDRMIFATGGAFTSHAQDFLENVGNPVLQKPFTRDELLRAVQQVGARSAVSEGPPPRLQLVPRHASTAQVG